MDIKTLIRKYNMLLDLTEDLEERKKLIIGLRMLQASLSYINVEFEPYLSELDNANYISNSLEDIIMQKKNHIPTEFEVKAAAEAVEGIKHYIENYKLEITNALHIRIMKIFEHKKFPEITNVTGVNLAHAIENMINMSSNKIRVEVHLYNQEEVFGKIPSRFAFGAYTKFYFDIYIYTEE